jgi:hypothetical protein
MAGSPPRQHLPGDDPGTHGGAPPAGMPAGRDGSLDVAVGDVPVLENARGVLAAQVAARICGLRVGPVAVLVRAVHCGGRSATVGESDWGPVTVSRTGQLPGTPAAPHGGAR